MINLRFLQHRGNYSVLTMSGPTQPGVVTGELMLVSPRVFITGPMTM